MNTRRKATWRLAMLAALAIGAFLADTSVAGTDAPGRRGQPAPSAASADAGAKSGHGDWIFDRGLYTNNPKTGQRVDQYQHERPAYRDPYSFFDSPHQSFPFAPDARYDLYPYYYGLYPYFAEHIEGAPLPAPFAPPPGYGPAPYEW
ncbi:MAG: hypothetical protein JW809_04280 [Pirellulales bacterium]|nr:hypothetical protein [Pirellulales bacterium]